MYYSGVDPETGKSVFVARNPHDKAMQRALMQYRNPKNRQLVLEALQKANRMDLVGNGPKCLIHVDEKNTKRGFTKGNANKNDRKPVAKNNTRKRK